MAKIYCDGGGDAIYSYGTETFIVVSNLWAKKTVSFEMLEPVKWPLFNSTAYES